ncbi:RDD family protein [Myxacorys almedinensis]|uniref:RDD family protein n=1 Tax=Myxacorys almedinensis A TaxID=2690445 RepID=A0A8J7YX03_9CYAN|nr:RDD family protein [Myxacorys almedinensis]NDJ15714.1 RDD family protein [Myxacorys almedinensis A]
MRLFNSVKVRTPESVDLEFTLAGIGNRAIALLIDYLLWGALLVTVIVLWGLFAYNLPLYFRGLANSEALETWLAAVAWLVYSAAYASYFVGFETLWQGQTPGKRYTKIRVICENGQPVGLAQAALRSLLRPVDDFLSIGLLLILFTKREKRLGDWVAGTLVIQEEPAIVSANVALSADAQPLADQLGATANISALLPDDFAVIRSYLQRRTLMEPKAKAELGLQLARQARTLIGLHELPFDMTPDLFLEAMYLAYQQQSS